MVQAGYSFVASDNALMHWSLQPNLGEKMISVWSIIKHANTLTALISGLQIKFKTHPQK
jgi:hypothetical protein